MFKWQPPAWVDAEAWEAFEEMRAAKGRRVPFTDGARKRIVIDLQRLQALGNDPAEVLWQSVVNGWSGVFALKIDYRAAAQQAMKRETQAQAEKREAEKTPIPDGVRTKISAIIMKMTRR